MGNLPSLECCIMMWVLYFCVLVPTLLVFINIYYGRSRKFWKNLKVPHTVAWLPFGDFQKGGWSNNIGVLFKKFYDEFAGEKFFGVSMFTNPVLIIRDPELIKTIFVKDFTYFHDRGVYYNEKIDPLSAHLFAIEGLKWKNMRTKLSPTFSSRKMKIMFSLVVSCSEELEPYLRRFIERRESVNMKEVAAMLMTDIISLCAFGIETNSMKNPNAEFRKMGKKSVSPSLKNLFLYYLQFTAPKVLQFLKIRIFPKDFTCFFLGAIKEVMDNREKNEIHRNDFLQLLMQLKNDGVNNDVEYQNGKTEEVEEKFTFQEVAAQAFVFFLGGFETSSATVQFALYELAKNLEIQEKLRKEVLNVLAKYDGQLTYECFQDMPYLDKVIDETLRKYPVVPTLQRECKINYKIPDSDVVIPKGTIIHIPIYGLHKDEKYYPEPDKFDPERFTEEEKRKRHSCTYLPFGEGPRNCIGKRFGLMQVKVALITLLRKFRFELSEKMKTPMTFDPRTFVLMPKGELYLKIDFI